MSKAHTPPAKKTAASKTAPTMAMIMAQLDETHALLADFAAIVKKQESIIMQYRGLSALALAQGGR